MSALNQLTTLSQLQKQGMLGSLGTTWMSGAHSGASICVDVKDKCALTKCGFSDLFWADEMMPFVTFTILPNLKSSLFYASKTLLYSHVKQTYLRPAHKDVPPLVPFCMHVFHLLNFCRAEPAYSDNTALSTSLQSVMNILAGNSQRGDISLLQVLPIFVLIGCNVPLNPKVLLFACYSVSIPFIIDRTKSFTLPLMVMSNVGALHSHKLLDMVGLAHTSILTNLNSSLSC